MSKKGHQSKPKATSSTREPRKSDELRISEFKSYPQSWYYLCWLLYLCYCYAAFVPTGPVWGIHFIAYIPAAAKVLLLVAGGLLLLPRIQRTLFLTVTNLFGTPKEERKIRVLLPAIIAGVCFALFHTFTIKTDIYGDSVNMLKWYGDNATFDWSWITHVLSPHWVDNKEALTVALHRTIAYVFSIPIESSYRIISELCGALFVFIWLIFVQKISSGPLRIVLILLGLFAGSVQVFFGHVENYSFGILTSTVFLVALYFYLEEKVGTLAFVLIYLLAFKAHIIAILFLPAVIVALAYHYRNALPKLQSLFTWRAILTVVVLPALAVGLVLYVFLFHSWNEPYALSTGRQFQQTFLQIIQLPAPLNHYSLWHPYHIADFLNIILMTAAPIVAVLMTLLLFNRKDISWSQPKVIVFGLAALFPFLFFFAMNPTLSPVRDWDVYTLLVPPLLFLASVLLIQPGVRHYAPAWLAQCVVFGVLFTTVLVAVNASPLELQPRLEDAGAYTYRSYYASSSYIEGRALDLNFTADAIPRFAKIVGGLAKGRIRPKDEELANMMSRLAKFSAIIGNDNSAIVWANAARESDTTDVRYIQDLAGHYIHGNKPVEASNVLQELLNREDHGDRGQFARLMADVATLFDRAGDISSAIKWASNAKASDPLTMIYAYDLADYYLQDNQPLQSLGALRSIPADSVTANVLIATALAARHAYGPDSALPYLYRAKAMAPNDPYCDSLIGAMKSYTRRKATR